MTTLEKLFAVDVGDVISISLAMIAVSWFTGGLNIAGVIGVIIGNRIMSVLLK